MKTYGILTIGLTILSLDGTRAEVTDRARRLAILDKQLALTELDEEDDRWIATVEDFTADSAKCTALANTLRERCATKKRALRAETSGDSELDSDDFEGSDFDEKCIVKFRCDAEKIIDGKLEDLFELDQLERDHTIIVDKDEDQDERKEETASSDEDNAGNDENRRQLGKNRRTPWGLERISEQDLSLNKNFNYNPSLTGNGVFAYVVDTGINTGHSEFEGRISQSHSVITSENIEDYNGHGSHVAGIIAGSRFGVAPDTRIIPVKVFPKSGSGPISNVVKGMKWAIRHYKQSKSKKPAILNLSLRTNRSPAVDAAAKSAVQAGMIVVVAAGNEGGDACNNSPSRLGGSAIRSHGVITVMASDTKDKLAWYSNSGKCADIIAPGSDILSAAAGNRRASKKASGTSQAAPHVSGVLAQFLEKHNFNRDAAIDAMFKNVVADKISDITRKNSKNILLQRPL